MISKEEYRLLMWPLKRRPKWNRRNAGLHPSPVVSKNGPTPMVYFRPNVNHICDQLLGSPVYGGYDQQKQERVITAVKYPEMDRRLRIFREALQIVFVSRGHADLLTLALYRRQVTETGDMPLDLLFLRAAEMFSLSEEQWEALAVRMPMDSWIYRQCKHRARLENLFMSIAAE